MVSSFYLPPVTAEVNLDLSREVSTRWLRTSVAKSEELRSSCTSRTMRIYFAHLIISREANCSRTAKCADTWEEVSSKHRLEINFSRWWIAHTHTCAHFAFTFALRIITKRGSCNTLVPTKKLYVYSIIVEKVSNYFRLAYTAAFDLFNYTSSRIHVFMIFILRPIPTM